MKVDELTMKNDEKMMNLQGRMVRPFFILGTPVRLLATASRNCRDVAHKAR